MLAHLDVVSGQDLDRFYPARPDEHIIYDQAITNMALRPPGSRVAGPSPDPGKGSNRMGARAIQGHMVGYLLPGNTGAAPSSNFDRFGG